jgi:hypothetical protein
MKTTSKQTVAMLLATALLLGYLIGEPDPNSPVTLVGICAFLASCYFTFRYNNQIKRQRELGFVPEPTPDAKRHHFWTLATSIGLGTVTGTCIIVYKLTPIFGFLYSLLLSIPYDLFMAYLVYWLWRKRYKV